MKEVTQQDVIAALDKAGARGITSDWLGDDVQSQVMRLLGHMRKAGEAFGIPTKNTGKRWFRTEALAQEYQRAKRAAIAPRVKRHGPLKAAAPFASDAVIVGMDKVQIQYGPSPTLALRSNTHGEHG